MSDTPVEPTEETDVKKRLVKGMKLKGKEKPQLDEIDEAVASSNVKADKKKKKKKMIKLGGSALGVLFLGYIIYLLFVPYKGTMAFGLCKVFVELNVQYPTTLKLNKVEEFATSVRIWYSHTDSFGEYMVEPIQCYFKPDERYGFALDKVTIRRRELDTKQIETFNSSIPVILASPPDLSLPKPPKDILNNLQIDLTGFIKPIL